MKFLKQEAGNLGLFLLLASVNSFIWIAYNLPMEPIVYILLSTGTFFVLVEGWRGYCFYHGKKLLERAMEAEGIDFESLPEKGIVLAKEYKKLLKRQEEQLRKLSDYQEEKALGMKRYYGLWTHQIKIPIAGIRLLLQEEKIDTKAVSRELYRIEQYVESTLSYQRLQAGNNDLLIKTYRTEDIIQQVMKRNSILLLRPDLKLEMELLDCPVLTDRKWLEFILEQLLSNAAKYTKDGRISIRVKDIEEAVDIIVEDTGIGICPEDLPRIFDWGYTGWNGHENKKSTGLGLALSRQAAQLLSHELFIDSQPGKGTKATVRIYRTKIDLAD